MKLTPAQKAERRWLSTRVKWTPAFSRSIQAHCISVHLRAACK